MTARTSTFVLPRISSAAARILLRLTCTRTALVMAPLNTPEPITSSVLSRLPPALVRIQHQVKYRELIKQIETAGWYFERYGAGSHMLYKHPSRPGSIVVAGG